MSNSEILKKYLIEKENAYLLDPNNNGKTIMLSGAWGSGKTHFWQNEIEPTLKEKLKDKACVYISLYGKESLNDIKSDVYLSANGNNLLSKEVATFGMETLSAIKDSDLAIGKAVKAGKALFDSKKMQKGIGKLKKGGVICFDDFERKSKNVDLNDLFGFISQLAINLECKVIIILNSEVFKDKEGEIFNRVKEKTISKFFYFKPSIEELLHSIFSDDKYYPLNEYKEDILSAIKETDELNARIYTQTLDNCLEWLILKGVLDLNTIRVLVLGTFNFVLNHLILDYQITNVRTDGTGLLNYNVISFYSKIFQRYGLLRGNSTTNYRIYTNTISDEQSIQNLKLLVTALNNDKRPKLTEKNQEEHIKWITNNESKLKALWKYGYRLYYVGDVDEVKYNEISQFIASGILT